MIVSLSDRKHRLYVTWVPKKTITFALFAVVDVLENLQCFVN